MTLKHKTLVGVASLACLVLTACSGSEPTAYQTARAGEPVDIVYRGQHFLARELGDYFVIEGDILVARDEATLVEPEAGAELSSQGSLGKSREAVAHIQDFSGVHVKWQNGNVPYSLFNVHDMIGNAGTPDAETAKAQIRIAMSWWQNAVRGLHFIEQSGACTAGPCLDMWAGKSQPGDNGVVAATQSSQGSSTSPTVSQVGDGIHNATTAHELGHALGLFHENQRPDAVTGGYISIVWNKTWGCKNSATTMSDCGAAACEVGTDTPKNNSIANGCCSASWFAATDTTWYEAGKCWHFYDLAIQALSSAGTAYAYDYASIMHYSTTSWSKDGSPTIVPTGTVPPGVTPGAATELSALDTRGVQAMYPVLSVNSVMFRNTGTQTLLRLDGRHEDINDRYQCKQGTLVVTSNSAINTNALTEGPQTYTCTGTGALWDAGYAYPNSTVTATGTEAFSTSQVTTVLNPGLIPVMFSPVFI